MLQRSRGAVRDYHWRQDTRKMFLTTCLDGVTADSPAQWQPFPREIGGRAMPIDGAFWRSLREDFESLQVHQFSLIWNSSPPLSFTGEPRSEEHTSELQ